MTTTLLPIELSQSEGLNLTTKNSDFIVNIPQREVKPNDIISFQQGYLKVAELDSSQIYIEEDIDVKISFGYYICNCFKNTFAKTTTPDVINNEPDYLYYVLYQCGDGPAFAKTQPIISYVSIPIKRGYYYPNDLAQKITNYFSSIQPEVNLYSEDPQGEPEFYSGSDLVIDFTWPDQPRNIQYLDPENRCFSRSDFISGNTGEDFVIVEAGWPDAMVQIGASQFELSFDPTTNKFQFNYLHTQFQKTGGQPVVALNYIGQFAGFSENISGIFLNDLSPPSFWKSLGFVVDNCCMKVGNFSDAQLKASTCFNQVGISYLPSFLASQAPFSTSEQAGTEGNQTGNGNVLNPFYPNYPNGFTAYIASQNTIPLIATNTYTPSLNSSFFKIDVEFGLATNRVQSGTKLYNLNCIASKQWLSAQIINIFSDSSIPYIHNSEFSDYISQFRVRILNQDNELVQLSQGSTIIMRHESYSQNALSLKPSASLNK